jgi:hypothetical protein
MVCGIRGSSPDSIQIDLVSGGLERLVLYRIPELLSSQCVYRSMEGTEMVGSQTRLEQDVRNRFGLPDSRAPCPSRLCDLFGHRNGYCSPPLIGTRPEAVDV